MHYKNKQDGIQASKTAFCCLDNEERTLDRNLNGTSLRSIQVNKVCIKFFLSGLVLGGGDCFAERTGANATGKESGLAATVIKVKGKGGVLGRRGLPCFALSAHRIDNDQ